ncbi:MAG: citrate/2-methylcitrate synthase [Oscillospiraceae bacterium]|nr:citrate/2-methylcitrate synthase [Oscillospiraceae bacterium]
MPYKDLTENNLQLAAMAEECVAGSAIDPELYTRYGVKRGLRELNGDGVLTGLTNISDIRTKKLVNGQLIPCEGELYYRGIRIEDLVDGCIYDDRMGFEETCFLLLFGYLPNREKLSSFSNLLSDYRCLPDKFVRDVVMKAPPSDIMNGLTRSVLTLYSYDRYADDISIPNVLRQCLQLISVIPLLSVYSYQAFNHYHNKASLYIHMPDPALSTAGNILALLRPDCKFTALEARVLDISLILHAEHGGGNNSTFTTHVVTSSGTDTYSAISAALCSLKGPRHGGANIKVSAMFRDLRNKISDLDDEDEIKAYLNDILEKRAFDKSGLIYGMGHAVYSLSDPRAKILMSFAEKIASEKGRSDEYRLLNTIDRLATSLIAEKKKIYKGVSANVDFYSGFVYDMLGIPPELYTPLFASARIAGWSAHRLEELIGGGKIIRPAYKSLSEPKEYVPVSKRI